MSRKALIDTNILLDAAMSERPDHSSALMFLDEIAYGEIEGLVTATALKDVYYVLGKYAGEPAARDFVNASLDAFAVVAVDETVCRVAANSNEPDFEDGVIRACAEQYGASFIISRDESAFRKSTIKRLSAHDYMELFCEESEI